VFSFDDDWRPESWDLPTPNAPLRAWLDRHGPVPSADEARRMMEEQLSERYPEDYEPLVFGYFDTPETLDFANVDVYGPMWLWGDERRSYEPDFEYWRVVYAVRVFYPCEEYLLTPLDRDWSRKGLPDSGRPREQCIDNPSEE
jgi:hypothetical protein